MAFRKTMPNGKKSRFYYMDVIVLGQHRINKSTRKTTKAEAEVVEREEIARAEEEILTANGQAEEACADMLLSEAIQSVFDEEWVDQADGVRSFTQALVCQQLIGDKPLWAVTDTDITQLRKTLRGGSAEHNLKPKAKATVNRYIAALRRVFRYMKRTEFRGVRSAVVPLFDQYKEENERQRLLAPSEEKALFKAAKASHPAYADLFKVLLHTGMRVGEALTLEYGRAIKFDTQEITVLARYCKTGLNGSRTIPMSQDVYKILKDRQRTYQVKPFPYTASQVSRVFRLLKLKIGIHLGDTEFVPHMLRHTYATRMVANGVPLAEVQALLGHTDIKMTRRYAKLTAGTFNNARALLNSGSF